MPSQLLVVTMTWQQFYCALPSSQQTTIDPTLENTVLMYYIYDFFTHEKISMVSTVTLGGFRVKASVVPASAAPGQVAQQPQSSLPSQGQKEGIRAQSREQAIATLELQNESKSELGAGVNQATEYEGKIWKTQRSRFKVLAALSQHPG